jgi:hypothetical protein
MFGVYTNAATIFATPANLRHFSYDVTRRVGACLAGYTKSSRLIRTSLKGMKNFLRSPERVASLSLTEGQIDIDTSEDWESSTAESLATQTERLKVQPQIFSQKANFFCFGFGPIT